MLMKLPVSRSVIIAVVVVPAVVIVGRRRRRIIVILVVIHVKILIIDVCIAIINIGVVVLSPEARISVASKGGIVKLLISRQRKGVETRKACERGNKKNRCLLRQSPSLGQS
jgi:hypothetical protein